MSRVEMTYNCVRSGRLEYHLLLPLVPKLRNNYKPNINYRKITYMTIKLIITNILLLSSFIPNEQMKIHHKVELINWLWAGSNAALAAHKVRSTNPLYLLINFDHRLRPRKIASLSFMSS